MLSLHISNTFAKKGVAKKLIQTLRAIMLSQEVDLVAGGFNGIAWRRRSRNNISTIDEVFMDSILPTPPGMLKRESQKTYYRNHEQPLALVLVA